MKPADYKKIESSISSPKMNNFGGLYKYLLYVKEKVYTKQVLRTTFPLEIYVELTDICNSNCVYCYKKMDKESRVYFMSDIVINKLIESIANYNSLLLIFEGGEPLLHPNFIEIYSKFKKYHIPIDILTNGLEINEKFAYCFEKIYDHEFDDIQISLDGIGKYNFYNRGSNGFKVIESIKILNKYNIYPRINCVITNFNYKGIINLINYLNDNLLISSLTLNTPIGISNRSLVLNDILAKELYLSIEEVKRKVDFPIFGTPIKIESQYDCLDYIKSHDTHMKCTALRSKICISTNGDIYPCVFMEGKTPPISNLMNESLEEIWNSETSEFFVRDLIIKNSICSSCLHATICPQICAGSML